MQKEKEVVIVVCRKCGWRWKPSPKRWRNKFNYGKPRTLRCPNCGTLNTVSREIVLKILMLNR